MATTMMMDINQPATLLPAAKASGRCPPSLIRNDQIIEGGVFEMAMLRALNRSSQGLILNTDPNENAVENFTSAMKMASGTSDSRILEQRRCLILAAIGSTAEKMPSNTTLKALMNAGLLVTIKSWLDDILASKVGGMDLLLHLLSNIIPLPVTKDMVTTSRLGKTVSSVEKHSICVGSGNESAIKSRIQQVKERWSASVKAQKNGAKAAAKRPPNESAPPAAKKAKREGSSLSNLLKKVDHTNDVITSSTETAEETASKKKQERDAKLKEQLAATVNSAKTADTNESTDTHKKKDGRRIHWADNSGQALAISEGNDKADLAKKPEPTVARKSRWSERKKKDIAHEKELLLQSRKAGVSVDNDKADMLNAMALMAMWQQPKALPQDSPPIQVTSNESKVQTNRISTTPAVKYASESEVPISPTLLDEVEKALELSSRNTAAPTVIPFFTPQATPNPAVNVAVPNIPPAFPPPVPPVVNAASAEATLETVLMMGLPLFLVGCNVQALQTLQANPGLLASFKDANGVYKQPELINLVQTLTQNVAPQAAQMTHMPAYPAPAVSVPPPAQNFYQPPAAVPFAPPPQPPQPAHHHASSVGYRGDQNVGDANLHISGYGPTTTNEEIIAMFAPYVHVTEIVNKSGFSFVNTNDPDGAKRAKEALNGSLLGGLPCRINPATRKAKNPNHSGGSSASLSLGGVEALPRNSVGQIDFSQVRDDRGNPATKNLFIAGYGLGTTEQQLRDFIGQHATVTSVVMKGTFSFVNCSDKETAVIARQHLGGQSLNGGACRINFAKETGRLGTSFDTTYGPASGSTYGRYG